MDVVIGLTCFLCGFMLMFAIHRVVFDYYAEQAKSVIEELKRQLYYPTNVEVVHTYAEPDDVTDLKFNE
jgi:hypothetical protein